ncbi:MAG: citrate (Si)-synthase [bacterium]|jgi:citrate synthase
MSNKLREKMTALVSGWREERNSLIKEYGDRNVSNVSVKQLFGGLRGVIGLVCDTSSVEPDKGLIIRNYPINQLKDRLPEEIFWLLLIGELPNQEELQNLQDELKKRSKVPDYVFQILRNMPPGSHPMAMFNTAILAMQKESIFAEEYEKGYHKETFWEYALEDALNIIAKLPEIAAATYRIRFNKGELVQPDLSLDWAANYAHMLGLQNNTEELKKLMRLYMVLHSDHEGGNVSAFTARTVGSALSDIYYGLSAGLNGLAGPLHGLANQECLRWILMVQEKFGGVPTDEQLREFTLETLNSGQVIPGYGHAVLRVTDPRFEAILEFGRQHCADDEIFQIVNKVYDVVPKVLSEIPKISNPWPNVDAVSGSVLYHYGIHELQVYTVLFSVSRALGICAQYVRARAVGRPITRPKSVTTKWLKNFLETNQSPGDSED